MAGQGKASFGTRLKVRATWGRVLDGPPPIILRFPYRLFIHTLHRLEVNSVPLKLCLLILEHGGLFRQLIVTFLKRAGLLIQFLGDGHGLPLLLSDLLFAQPFCFLLGLFLHVSVSSIVY